MSAIGRYLLRRKIKKYAKKMPKALASEFGNKKEYSEEEVEVILKITKLYKTDTTRNSYAYAMYCSKEGYMRYLATSAGVEDYAAARELIRETLFPDATGFNFSSLLIDASNPFEHSNSNGSSGVSGADYGSDTGDSGGSSD